MSFVYDIAESIKQERTCEPSEKRIFGVFFDGTNNNRENITATTYA